MGRYAQLMAAVLVGDGKSFVVFEGGTVVVIADAEGDADLSARAVTIMEQYGSVVAGGPAGDFETVRLTEERGWAITSHHPDLLTLVLPDEVTAGTPSVEIGLLGRSKRHQDSLDLQIVHVEDGRGRLGSS